ncbi:MAG: AAA family ATPase, partial [Actinophytocola sp.]|uniref:AAA family ATPase n=1 Tax=Actinophytocola sp. TaxID=1872138 RepID=UPI003D6B3092
MRPLRLVFEGFGSYRDHTDVQLSDVDFFVLTGPTGSGKSTVIDALCFALYGTVPRWGKGNVIRNALAPSVNEGRVCLVFEAAGGRYAAARQLRRDARGNVHTKEARLDRLDAGVPPDADMAKILEAVVRPEAEGDKVTGAVSELLGIGYDQFTQCVVLPQGRFAEFLQAKPGDRQDLLIQLLAYAVYEDVGQRARERAKVAVGRLEGSQQRLAELGTVTDDVIAAATRRVADLEGLVSTVDTAVERMAELRTRWAEANAAAKTVEEQLRELRSLRQPGDVVDLSTRLTAADESVAKTVEARVAAEQAEAEADAARAGLPEHAELSRWRDAHARSASLAARLARSREVVATADEADQAAAAKAADAEQALADAEAAQA